MQWAKHLGANVIGTVSTEEKAKNVLEAGADSIILYSKQDFAEETNQLTDGHGADIIIDGVGKSTFQGDLKAVALRGQIIIFGGSSGCPADPISPNSLMGRSVTVCTGSLPNFIATRQDLLRRANDVMQGILEGVAQTAHRSDYWIWRMRREAHRLMENRETSGKILL